MKTNFLFSPVFTMILFFSCKKNEIQENGPLSDKISIKIDSIIIKNFVHPTVFVSRNGPLSAVNGSGVCWGTAPHPIATEKNSFYNGYREGFSVDVKNLVPFTQYYFRTYYVSGRDTIYSRDTAIITGGLQVLLEREFPHGTNSPRIIQMTGDENTGFVLLSNVVRGEGYDGSYPCLTKIDAAGNVLWHKDYNDGLWKYPEFMKKLADGYIIGSVFYYGIGDVRVVLLRTDLNGNKVWEREFKKEPYQNFIHFKEKNGKFFLTMRANTTQLFDGLDDFHLWDFIVNSNDGSVEDEKVYPRFPLLQTIYNGSRSVETAEQGYLIFDDVLGNGNQFDIQLQKLDSSHNLLWSTRYGTETHSDYINGIILNPNGNYTVVANQMHYPRRFLVSAWFFEVSKNNGKMLWEYLYHSDRLGENTYVSAYDIKYTDNYYSTGSISGPTGTSTLPFIIKFDKSGKPIWDWVIDAKNGYRFSRGEVIHIAPNNDIYMFGVKNKSMSEPSLMFMVKLKEQ